MFLGEEYLMRKQIALVLCAFIALLFLALMTGTNPFIVHPEVIF